MFWGRCISMSKKEELLKANSSFADQELKTKLKCFRLHSSKRVAQAWPAYNGGVLWTENYTGFYMENNYSHSNEGLIYSLKDFEVFSPASRGEFCDLTENEARPISWMIIQIKGQQSSRIQILMGRTVYCKIMW